MPSQADNTIAFTFDGPQTPLSEADLQSAVATPENPDFKAEVPQTKSVPVEAKVEATEPDEKAETPQVDAKEVSTPSELKTYKITVDGQELTVTEDDLKSGHMRHRDYTQKTQRLAEEQRAFAQREAEYQAYLQRVSAVLENAEELDKYRAATFGAPQGQAPLQPPTVDLSQPITAQDVARISAYNVEVARRELEAKFSAQTGRAEATAAAALAAQRAADSAKLKIEIDSHVSGILDKYPDLKGFDEIQEELSGEAAKRLPPGATLAQAKAELTQAAERRMAVIQSINDRSKKASAIEAAKLKRGSIEPPGGAPASKPGGKPLTLNSSDQKAFLKAAVADLQAFQDANS